MGSGAAFETGSIDGPNACRRWLDRLPAEPDPRVGALAALLARVEADEFASDPALEILELVRPPLLAEADRLASRLRAITPPFAPEHVVSWRAVANALERLHRAYRRVYTGIVEANGLDTRAVIPGATNALRVAMPLVRGLDALARRLALALLARIDVDPAEWLELSSLARHVRRTTFLDEPVPDPIALARPVSARAAVTYPLLLLAGGVESRSAAHIELIDKLARRWAAKVGFRFDVGEPLADNPHGPTLRLGAQFSARLDTHRLQRSLAERRDGWLAGSRSGRRGMAGLDRAALSDLLDELAVAWSARNRGGITACGQPTPVRLRIGLPSVHRSRAELAAPGADAGGKPYAYGRWEQNTILRMALGQDQGGRNALAAIAGESEHAERVAQDAGVWLVDRRAMTPHARRGELVSLIVESRGADEGADHLLLARVESIRQIVAAPGSADGRSGHRLRIAVMPGRAQPVGVRGPRQAEHVDGFLLESAAETVLVVAPDTLVVGDVLWIRHGDDDGRARVLAMLDRSRGHERFSIRLEAG